MQSGYDPAAVPYREDNNRAILSYALKSKGHRDFAGVMIEVNKRFYCDRNGDVIEGRILQLRQIMEKILVDCIGTV